MAKKRRYKAMESTIKKDLMNTMNKISATSLKIWMNEFTGEVEVVFDRNGKRYTKICSLWENYLDNLRAIGLSIEYLYRAVEIYGVESQEEFNSLLDQTFIGIEATPDDSVLSIGFNDTWWKILGVKSDAQEKEIKNAYKSLARIHHPDSGGDVEQFKKIRKAYDEGMEILKWNKKLNCLTATNVVILNHAYPIISVAMENIVGNVLLNLWGKTHP